MKYILALCLSLSLTPIFSQDYFTGEITYQIEIIPKSDTVDVEKILEDKPGTTAKYLITDGYYKSTYFKKGELTYSYTYHDETRRMYDDSVDKPFITFRDSRKSNSQYSEPQILKDSAINVLDFVCYAVITDADFGKETNYYSDNLKINYETFKGHKVGNWYEEMKAADGALSLKSIIEYDNYFQVQTMVSFDRRKVDRDEFNLPESKPIAASSSALDKQVEIVQPTEEQIKCYLNKVSPTIRLEFTEKMVVYVNFLVTKDGQIKYIRPFQKDSYGLYEVAIDIVENCGLKFMPGQIDGAKVDSEAYLPVKFNQ